MFRICFICLLIACFFSSIAAQTFPYLKYTVHDGLPQSQVMGLFQDSRGYIWIKTKNGLAHFDGFEFTSFNKDKGLPDNYISQITEDGKSRILALSKQGISLYEGNQFKFISPPPEIKQYPFYHVMASSDDKSWLLLERNSSIKDLILFQDSSYFNISEEFRVLKSKNIICLYYNRILNELWIQTKEGILYSWKNQNLELLFEDVLWVKEYDHKIFLKTRKSLFRIEDRKPIPVKQKEIKNKIVYPLYYHYQPDHKLTFFNDSIYSTQNWRNGWINDVLIDDNNVIWIATEEGLFRLLSDAFLNFTSEDGLAGNIWSVVEDKNGHIWFASYNVALQEYDGKNIYNHNEFKEVQYIQFYMGSHTLRNGVTYFNTHYGAIQWDGEKFSNVEFINSTCQYIYENPYNKEILFATAKELIKKVNDDYYYYPEFKDSELGYVMSITLDKNGIYWLVTTKKIVLFDGNNILRIIDQFSPGSRGMAIETDSTGRIWLGGEQGLLYYDTFSGLFMPALPDELAGTVHAIKSAGKEKILVGRIRDLLVVDLNKWENNRNESCKIYDQSNGFFGSECGEHGIIPDSKGFYWIITSDMVTRFDLSGIQTDTIPPRTYITAVEIQRNNENWKTFEISSFYKTHKNITLDHRSNNIRFNFTGISTPEPGNIKFQYRLLGYHNFWSKPDKDRFADFIKIPPGDYVFEVKAMNTDRVWSVHPATIHINIEPALWQRTLSWILAFITFSFILALIVYLWTKNRHRKQEEWNRLLHDYSRLEIATIFRQYDPHFTFNVIASMGSLLKGEKNKAYDYYVKLSSILRSALIEHDNITRSLGEEIEFVKNYCEIQKFRFNERFKFSISIHKEEVDLKHLVPKMIIQTFVENAVKHGLEHKLEGGHVNIVVKKDNSTINILITDNGIGRKAAEDISSRGTGKGLELTRRLVEILNSNNTRKILITINDRSDEDGNVAGTEVLIEIPENYNYN